MAATASPGAGTGITPISPTGGTNLDQFIASIGNLTGTQGTGLLAGGGQQYQTGLASAAPALSFLTSLVKGDQGDVAEATQPQVDQITQQFDQIRNMISAQPRGGGKTTALAEAPFQKAGDIQRTQGAARTAATSQLSSLSTNLAGLGISEQGLGAGLEGQAASVGLGKQGLDYSQPSTLDTIEKFASTLSAIL